MVTTGVSPSHQRLCYCDSSDNNQAPGGAPVFPLVRAPISPGSTAGVSPASPDEGEVTFLSSGRSLSHPAASLSPGPWTRGLTQTVQTFPTDVSPVVKSCDGTPGLAQTFPGALSVADTIVGEGKDAGRVR